MALFPFLIEHKKYKCKVWWKEKWSAKRNAKSAENGIAVNPNVNKDLFAGISRVKLYLKNANNQAKLFIFSSCTNLIRELKNYYWGDGDKPVKIDDHALDELRYYIMSRPEPTIKKAEKTEIQKNKEKLYKQILRQKKFI